MQTSPAQLARDFLDRANWVQFGSWLCAVLVLKVSGILEPPVWDSVTGVFPPAVFLYNTNFDLNALLQQSGWWEGGANVTSYSLLTWIIAIVMWVTNSATVTIGVLHAMTFAGFGWALFLYSRILFNFGISPQVALAATGFLLVMPVVLVQAGYIYTEMAVLIFSVASLARFQSERVVVAAIFALIALLFKLTGIAIVGCLGLAILLSRRRFSKESILALLILACAVILKIALPGLLGGDPAAHFREWGTPASLAGSMLKRLLLVTDLGVLYIGSLAISIYLLAKLLKTAFRVEMSGKDLGPNGSKVIPLMMPLLFTGGIALQILSGALFLPRYLVPLVPFCIATLLLWLLIIDKERIGLGVLLVGCVVSLANFNGDVYIPSHYSFSIVERSHDYRNFVQLQTDIIESIDQLPKKVPVYVTREVYYMMSDPMMGYVDSRPDNVLPIFRSDYSQTPLLEFPSEFYLCMSNYMIVHGAKKMSDLVKAARASGQFTIEETQLSHTSYSGKIYRLSRVKDVGAT